MPRTAIALFVAFLPLFAQNVCETGTQAIQPAGSTMFSPQQEGYLGDVIAEILRQGLPTYRQPGLTDPLDRIAARLLDYLPPNEYKFQFTLIETRTPNAFAVAGGRIFVSRRLIGMVENEDELAGVLAHEMGHILARQSSVSISKLFQDTLRATSVGDREDIFRKMNQLIDAATKRRNVKRSEDDQLEADRISSAAVWRAGYDPEGLPRFFDRLTNNQGATGNVFSDLFGATRPESRRYHEMLRELAAIPASCRAPRASGGEEEFQAWRKRVVELSLEDLLPGEPAREPQIRLTPKMRPEITNIKFSPDGRLLLAQDDSGIHILQREPFQHLFRIPALAARAAMFHPDSAHVVLQNGSSGIDVWNLETRERENRWEPNITRSCQDVRLSPNGRTLACVAAYGTKVWLFDTATGAEVARHSITVANPLAQLVLILFNERASGSGFSPDGSVFVFGPAAASQGPWAFDLNQRAEITIGRPLRNALGDSFAFMSADVVAALHKGDPKDSGLFTWPEGKQLSKFVIPNGKLAPVAKGQTLLLRPLANFAVAAMDVEERAIFQVSNNAALDRYENTGAAERVTGELALYRGRSTQPSDVVALPEADLGRVRAGAHSADLEWLTLSVEGRSQVWNLRTGQATLAQTFDAAFVSPEGLWTATIEVPARDPEGRPAGTSRVRRTYDLRRQAEVRSVQVAQTRNRRFLFSGQYEVETVTDPRGKDNPMLQVRDSVSGRSLWLREFEEVPRIHVGNALVLQYGAKEKTADRIIKASEALKEQLASVANRDDVALLEVVALDTGKVLGNVLVEVGGGELVIRNVQVAGRNLFIEDANDRTLAYSLDAGGRAGQQFGSVLAVDSARGLAAMEIQPGAVVVYDGTMQPVAEFVYPRDVIYAGFDGEGKRLLVVTGEQDVFIENL